MPKAYKSLIGTGCRYPWRKSDRPTHCQADSVDIQALREHSLPQITARSSRAAFPVGETPSRWRCRRRAIFGDDRGDSVVSVRPFAMEWLIPAILKQGYSSSLGASSDGCPNRRPIEDRKTVNSSCCPSAWTNRRIYTRRLSAAPWQQKADWRKLSTSNHIA